MIQPRTILCIDDACTFLQVFRTHFEDRGYRVLTASSRKEGLELLAAKRVDAVILDYQMPGMTSAAALQVAKRVSPETLVVILWGAASTVPQDETTRSHRMTLGSGFRISEIAGNRLVAAVISIDWLGDILAERVEVLYQAVVRTTPDPT
jgi:CheY-like chemotaxis protein